MSISKKHPMLKAMLEHPLRWELRCPICSSSCNIKYLLGLQPRTELDCLPYFYCPSHRFVGMEPRPVSLHPLILLLILHQSILSVLALLTKWSSRR